MNEENITNRKTVMNKTQVTINGKKYSVKIIAGVRYINGKTIDEFLEGLDPITVCELAEVGYQAVIDERWGTKPCKYQKMMDRSYLIKKANAN